MKVDNLKTNVAVAFDYTYSGDDGGELTERIETTVKRIPFRDLKDLQKRFQKADDDPGEIIAAVAPLIVSWNVTGADNAEYPHDTESLEALPFDFVIALTEAILGKLLPATSKATPAN